MMDIQSPACFRPTTSLPLDSSANALTLASHQDSSPKYNFARSHSYQGNMVVESQTMNFRPMTPDPHPDIVDKIDTEKLDLPQKRGQQGLSLPPEGALTPSSEPSAKKPRFDHSSEDYQTKEGMDFMGGPPVSNYPTSPVELRQEEKADFHANMNGIKYPEKLMKDFTNSSDDTEDISSYHERQQKLSESLPLKTTQSLLEAAFKIGLDTDAPTLSPKTMSDTDVDIASTGSPSVSGERRRRKPNLEDIVRRMKEVETDYYSEEDSECEDEMMNRECMDGGDEVDGDFTIVRMPMLGGQVGEMPEGMKPFDGMNMNTDEFMSRKFQDGGLNENNNIIDKRGNGEERHDENGEIESNENSENERDGMGIPLPASSKPDGLGSAGDVIHQKEPIMSQGNFQTPPKMNNSGWLHTPFSGFPLFPFQASPPDLPFSNFMSPFDNKFPTPELEKDYLKCQYCERTFRRQKNLENHIENTHHGKSPQRKKPGENDGQMYFKCTHCPYTTKHQSNLYVHLRIHTGERPYICGACGVQYSQSHSLKSHIINKHDGIMSYYIKEKRTRSPRGLGYLTQCIPGESPIFKMPAAPLLPPNMSHLHGNLNGLPFQHSPQQNFSLKHSPHSFQHGMGLHNSLPSSVPHSPVLSPNRAQPGQQQMSPNGLQKPQMSPQHSPMHRPPFPPLSHLLPDGMDMAQKSLELAKLGLMNFPYYSKPFHNKPSPPFHMNGHGPISPQYNGFNHAGKQSMEHSLVQGGQHMQQFHKIHNPLQEIHENKIQDENGAIDLTNKRKEEAALDLAISEKTANCLEDGGKCPNCLHLLKLRMLRMNVVRMLSILVPNLNFEEKGINAEGDSVDDLLRDVIESNLHDEEND